jgi:SAM-dependent methyltransferase
MKKIRTWIQLIKQFGIINIILNRVKKVCKLGKYKPMKDIKEIEKYFFNKNGLEIGGPSKIFSKNGFMPIYDKILTLNGVNFSPSTIWTGTIDQEKGLIIDGKRVGKQYILDTVNLSLIGKDIYDFVLSSNNIEHIANPIKAVEQWLSVLKRGGILVIVAPRKEATFDHKREIVTYDHLMNDYQNEIKEDDLTHLEEILSLHDLKLDPLAGTIEQFTKRSLNNYENRCLHHHVFDLDVLSRIYEYFNLSIIKSVERDQDYIIIGQKQR